MSTARLLYDYHCWQLSELFDCGTREPSGSGIDKVDGVLSVDGGTQVCNLYISMMYCNRVPMVTVKSDSDAHKTKVE